MRLASALLSLCALAALGCEQQEPTLPRTASLHQDVAPAREPGQRRVDSVWADAQARGVALRAVGNEPGWLLELHPEGDLKLLLNYGVDSLRAPAPAPAVAGDSTVYALSIDRRAVRVVVHPTPCDDAMSGERFAQTVRVTVDDAVLDGCGRAF